MSFLINLPRTLSFFELIEGASKAFSAVSILDISLRFIFIFIYSWTLLLFNTHWRNTIVVYNLLVKESICILINILIYLLGVKIFINIYQSITEKELLSSERGLVYFIYFVIAIVLVFISRILIMQRVREQDRLEKEKLKQENLINELNVLRNQINPHFLFNSLNSLNSLVRGNEKATGFVNNLSKMYRYILQCGEEDLAIIKDELFFLNNYIHLIKTRYRDNFQVDIKINDSFLSKEIPTMTLQLLVENAVKHNEISSENPLKVVIYNSENELIIENRILKRNTFVDSTGKGLSNIDQRYFLLKKKHINISDANNIFKIKLPLN